MVGGLPLAEAKVTELVEEEEEGEISVMVGSWSTTKAAGVLSTMLSMAEIGRILTA